MRAGNEKLEEADKPARASSLICLFRLPLVSDKEEEEEEEEEEKEEKEEKEDVQSKTARRRDGTSLGQTAGHDNSHCGPYQPGLVLCWRRSRILDQPLYFVPDASIHSESTI